MRFLVDMNLSPRWCEVLRAEGWDAVHWSEVGIATAPDSDLMEWAFREGRIVLTHDLDFGAMLAATQSAGPSVAQVRTQDVRPEALSETLIPLLRQFEAELKAGVLLIVDAGRSRVRVLPLSKD